MRSDGPTTWPTNWTRRRAGYDLLGVDGRGRDGRDGGVDDLVRRQRPQVSGFDLWIPGVPVPQGRARAFAYIKGGKARARVYDPKASLSWKEHVAQLVRQRVREMDWSGFHSGEAIAVILDFVMPRPKSLPKRVEHHTRRPDEDNLGKAVKDALRGYVYHDDSQAVLGLTRKRYENDVSKPGVHVQVQPIDDAVDLWERF